MYDVTLSFDNIGSNKLKRIRKQKKKCYFQRRVGRGRETGCLMRWRQTGNGLAPDLGAKHRRIFVRSPLSPGCTLHARSRVAGRGGGHSGAGRSFHSMRGRFQGMFDSS